MTHGIYGFRFRGIDKTTYCADASSCRWMVDADGIPVELGLGVTMLRFCQAHEAGELKEIYDRIITVNTDDRPEGNDRKALLKSGMLEDAGLDWTIREARCEWYDALKAFQGKPESLVEMVKKIGWAYMTDDRELIRRSSECGYGYIVDLDTERLEVWKSSPEEPGDYGRYGAGFALPPYEDPEYPCVKVLSIPLDEIYGRSITSLDVLVDKINEAT